MAPTIDLTFRSTDPVQTTNSVGTLGDLFGVRAEADAALAEVTGLIAQTKDAVATDTSALILLTTGGKVSAYGPGSRFGALVHDTLGVTAAAPDLQIDNHGQLVSFEFVAETNPRPPRHRPTPPSASRASLAQQVLWTTRSSTAPTPGPTATSPTSTAPRGTSSATAWPTRRRWSPTCGTPSPDDGDRHQDAAGRAGLQLDRQACFDVRDGRGVALVATLAAVSLFVGVADITVGDVLTGRADYEIIALSRLPRTLALILAGAALSVAGLIMQLLTRNVFVEPSTAGILDFAALGLLVTALLWPGAPIMAKMVLGTAFALLGTALFLRILAVVPLRDVLVVSSASCSAVSSARSRRSSPTAPTCSRA